MNINYWKDLFIKIIEDYSILPGGFNDNLITLLGPTNNLPMTRVSVFYYLRKHYLNLEKSSDPAEFTVRFNDWVNRIRFLLITDTTNEETQSISR